MNNRIFQRMSKQPQSMLYATKCLIQILDVKYEQTDIRALLEGDCKYLSVSEQAMLLELIQEFKELLNETLGDWDCKTVYLHLKQETKT